MKMLLRAVRKHHSYLFCVLLGACMVVVVHCGAIVVLESSLRVGKKKRPHIPPFNSTL